VLGFALLVGAVSFLNGLAWILVLFGISGTDQERLFLINAGIGTAVVTLSLGGMLVYQASSSLGGVGSSVMPFPRRWTPIAIGGVALFAVCVAVGQHQVNTPERLPSLFPFTNLLIVTIPSTLVAVTVTRRYLRYNPIAWPLSWREWTSAAIYGAVGATAIAGIINTLYLVFGSALLIHLFGEGHAFDINDNLPTLPRALGMVFDLSVLSVVAPLNEEFWKGMIVAFFYRKGGAARCLLWGVLAGAGFNVLETFQNSLSVISPDAVSEVTIGSQWWLFATARAGTALIHATATGCSALGFYGLFRHRPRYMLGYPAGVCIHGSWNFLNYTLYGDAFQSQAGPDSRLLDLLSIAGLLALAAGCAVLLWALSRRVRDGFPAPIYRALGMLPAATPEPTQVATPGEAMVASAS
jgi:hypothetical protein